MKHRVELRAIESTRLQNVSNEHLTAIHRLLNLPRHIFSFSHQANKTFQLLWNVSKVL